VTVAAQASIEGFGISGSDSFEVNSSPSVSTLNSLTQTVDSSTGIQVNKPEFTDLVADNYLYSFAGFILGQASPDGTLQTIPLTDENDNPINVQTTGPLTVAFLADPFQVNLPWWRQAYTKPNVGLNHPERWDWSKSTQTAAFNPADQSSSTPQDQAFYHIKGFFITPADAGGTGPQLTQATAGDTLQLQARVYNFSLADMAAGTQVHAQFYAQRYENAQLVGDSFLIGETTLPALCGFKSSSQACSGQPNWGLASTTFDTGAFGQTKAGDVFLIFWVLVWMQDGQGNVVAELPDHGLTSSFTPSTTFAQITQVPIEAHSNNVGFYNYTGTGFYIASPGSELAATPTEPGDLAVDSLRVESAGAIPLDQKTQVTLGLRTGDTALGRLSVVFYWPRPPRGSAGARRGARRSSSVGLCRGVLCHGPHRAGCCHPADPRCADHRSCPRAHRPMTDNGTPEPAARSPYVCSYTDQVPRYNGRAGAFIDNFMGCGSGIHDVSLSRFPDLNPGPMRDNPVSSIDVAPPGCRIQENDKGQS
jgi:hypothetical protein